MKLGVIFGGMSTEHDVSVVSGVSVIKNLNLTKYEVFPIYIDKEGRWFEYTKKVEEIPEIRVGEQLEGLEPILSIEEYIQKMDCVFPVLHGLYGEDGTVQGLLELFKVPYVGCKVLSSAVSMDKVYTKLIFEKAGLQQAKYLYIRKSKQEYVYIHEDFEEEKLSLREVVKRVEQSIPYPVFVKPSNSGSSVGVKKAQNGRELEEAISFAGGFDSKILIEEGINAREVECAVLGGEEIKASNVGEILSAEEFYSFDSKYKNPESKTVIPANLEDNIREEIRKQAIKAFRAVDGSGLARVDFFVEKQTKKIYINEINTMPGFTQISMYPKLWQANGMDYTELLDQLIEIAMQKR